MNKKYCLAILLILFVATVFAQSSSIQGVVKDENGNAINDVSISYNNEGTTTDVDGNYKLAVNTLEKVTVTFSHLSFTSYSKAFTVPKGKTVRFSPKLNFKTEEIKEVYIKNRRNDSEGITNVDIKDIKEIPGANAGVENVLMTFAGVNNNNELSTQYNVRGGNFDENLVYVNGIEVYRPFLVRSGQQEGLSFINVGMTKNVNFSAGGFQENMVTNFLLFSILPIVLPKRLLQV